MWPAHAKGGLTSAGTRARQATSQPLGRDGGDSFVPPSRDAKAFRACVSRAYVGSTKRLAEASRLSVLSTLRFGPVQKHCVSTEPPLSARFTKAQVDVISVVRRTPASPATLIIATRQQEPPSPTHLQAHARLCPPSSSTASCVPDAAHNTAHRLAARPAKLS